MGLRERKSARTAASIERAAIELALERGFEHTTVNEIAARADVAPRTVFDRYAHKEWIIFGDEDSSLARLQTWLDGPGDDVLERLGNFVSASVDASRDNAELERMRLQATLTDPYLRRVLRGRLDTMERVVAARLAGELDLPDDDDGPRVFAAAISGLFLAMADKALRDPDCFDPLTACAGGLVVLRAGLNALQR